MLIAFGVPTPAMDPRQHIGDVMMVGAALFWAATTLIIKASPLTRASAEKVMLYQLVVSAPIMAATALVVGERLTHMPSASITRKKLARRIIRHSSVLRLAIWC